ncbi:MAG: type I restriction-modification system subunit M, partial [Aquificaceae bacterium]|nr:type I restriction-modification system subunit M [Aquificaceae bacterium]
MTKNLASEIWRACDILRRDNNCTGIMEYVQHLSWLLFLRFLDAQEEDWESKAIYKGEPYKPVIEKPYRWKDWARKSWRAEELLSFIHNDLIPYLKNLSGSPVRDTIRSVFSDLNVIVCASGYNLMDVIQIVDSIDFHSREDAFTVSQVYEELLRRLGHENKMAGEFYTPRPVVRFVVELVDPQIGETVYDPACGTCGFLIEAFLWMENKAKTTQDLEMLQNRTFYGQEKKPIPAMLGLMNMVLHGIHTPKVLRKNTLEEDIRNPSERFDVVLTNPPFGGKEGKHIQQNFPIQSQATELLFLQHIMKKLKRKDGARCGMVVPEGTLFRGGAFAEVKKNLLEEFNLHTIVSLPPGTFAPYSDVKTALIFFERPGPTKEIWYYELPLPEGLKKFSKGSPISDEHFEEAR